MARPREPEVDHRILEAAGRLVRERGYDALTMGAIAEAAGVGKPTVYRRFANKEAVLFALNVRDASPVGPVDTGSLREDVRAVCWAVARTLTPESRAVLGSQLGRAIADESAGREFLERTAGQSDVYMRPLWERGIARGEVDPDLDYVTARTALGTALIFSLLLYRLDSSCVDQIADMWASGVAPRPPAT